MLEITKKCGNVNQMLSVNDILVSHQLGSRIYPLVHIKAIMTRNSRKLAKCCQPWWTQIYQISWIKIFIVSRDVSVFIHTSDAQSPFLCYICMISISVHFNTSSGSQLLDWFILGQSNWNINSSRLPKHHSYIYCSFNTWASVYMALFWGLSNKCLASAMWHSLTNSNIDLIDWMGDSPDKWM